jgi:hypothetical protein
MRTKYDLGSCITCGSVPGAFKFFITISNSKLLGEQAARGHDNDAWIVALAEDGQQEIGQAKGGEGVCGQGGLMALLRDDPLFQQHARIVDQHIQRVADGLEAIHKVPDLAHSGNIHEMKDDLDLAGSRFVDYPLDCGFASFLVSTYHMNRTLQENNIGVLFLTQGNPIQ